MIHDVDNDGKGEVIWADWNTQGHKCGKWELVGQSHVFGYNHDGSKLFETEMGSWWNNKDLALADVDGDGVQEVLANGPNGGGDGIWYLDSRTGAKEAFVGFGAWVSSRGPVVADLWGTGTMQWVIPVHRGSSNREGAIQVYDTGQPYSAAWPHTPGPMTGTPMPPPTGDFDATFRIKSPNTWWQEVTITPAKGGIDIVDVRVRLDGGAWRGMSKAHWGPWTSSYNAPAGTKVEFIAMAAGGAQSQSLPFTWLDGQLTKGSTTPGSSGGGGGGSGGGGGGSGGGSGGGTTFAPRFEVSPNINEWWVEVSVVTTDPLKQVQYRVDGGAWGNLDKTPWNTYAKSVKVVKGSKVEFRAENNFAQSAISPVVDWLNGGGGASFFATFLLSPNVNNWWVEVKVNTPGKAVEVHARINGGAWFGLDKTPWNNWAKTHPVASGSSVEFRATNTVGAHATSPAFTWP